MVCNQMFNSECLSPLPPSRGLWNERLVYAESMVAARSLSFSMTKCSNTIMLRDRGLILAYSPRIQYLKGKPWYRGLQVVDGFATTARKQSVMGEYGWLFSSFSPLCTTQDPNILLLGWFFPLRWTLVEIIPLNHGHGLT